MAILLKFYEKHLSRDATTVNSTSSSTLQDDITLNFTLHEGDGSKVALILYQSNNNNLTPMHQAGMKNAIKVDSAAACGHSYDAPDDQNRCCRNMTFWIGVLTEGVHTIKGQYASQTGNTISTLNRIIAVYLFDGDTYDYIDDTTQIERLVTAFGNDTPAVFNVTPPDNCYALLLYNASSMERTHTPSTGFKIAMQINSMTEYGEAGDSGCASSHAYGSVNAFTFYMKTLTPVSQTFQGRFAGNTGRVYIDRRQFGYLLFDKNYMNFNLLDNNDKFQTTSTAFVNDADHKISYTNEGEVLVLAMATKYYPHGGDDKGYGYGISIDGIFKHNTRGSCATDTDAMALATFYGDDLTLGYHTIRGVACSNSGDEIRIDKRLLLALWLNPTNISQGYSIIY